MSPETISALTALFYVVWIDVVLAGDNAVVVGTAAAGLPHDQQKKVIFLGAILALVARVAFALIATYLLDIIGLLFAGGLLLLWVAWKMWREIKGKSHESHDSAAKPARPKTVRSAIVQVALADISMSLDNVLAVAGAAREHPIVLVFGLVLSIALMAVAAGFIARIIDRHPWLAYLGLVIILWVAGKMIYEGAMDVMQATGTVPGT
jgi:YjbE family integral membrane protein